MTSWLKRIVGGGVGAGVSRLLGRAPTSIWCLHRFVASGDPWIGDDVDVVARQLRRLVDHGVQLIPLADAVTPDPGARRPRLAVTVDDGYADFATRAWPMFKALGCPVTVFLTTAPILERQWFWWDRLEQALQACAEPWYDVDELGTRITRSASDGSWALHSLKEALKVVPNAERLAILQRIEASLASTISATAEAAYAALNADDVLTLSRAGVDFGAHTVNHPILSRCTNEEAAYEISRSVDHVAALTGRRINSFAYPNGARGDFGAREEVALRAAGIATAVTTSPSHPDATTTALRVPRYVYSPCAYSTAASIFGFDWANREATV